MTQSAELDAQTEYNFISSFSDSLTSDDKDKTKVSFVGFNSSDTQLEDVFWDSQAHSVNANGITVNFNGIGNNIWNYNKEDYIETLTGNRVSRKSILCGSQNIRLAGKVKFEILN